MHDRKRENEGKMCKGCGLRRRHDFFGLCPLCKDKRRRYGTPKGTALPRSFYVREWGEVKKFIKWFDYHPSIIAALKYFDAWLEAAQLGKCVPGQKAIARLADRGCTGAMALQEVLSVYLYASRRQTPATAAPFLLANAFLRSSPGAKRGPQASPGGAARSYQLRGGRLPPSLAYISFKERKAIADAIRETLRNMFFEMLEHFKRKDRLHNEQVKAMSEPFPVLLTRRQHADLRCRAERAKEGSPYKGPGNPTGVNQWTKKERKEENSGDAAPGRSPIKEKVDGEETTNKETS
jgi:hypothetical protein